MSSPPPPTPDASTDHTITLKLTPFTLPPGGEATKCQGFANPTGAAIDVKEIESHMTVGSHHMLLTTAPDMDVALADCTGATDADTLILYGSQDLDSDLKFPDGVALRSHASQGMAIQSHYLNASDNDITANVEITLHLGDPSLTQMVAGAVQYTNQEFTIPPGPPDTTVTKTCTVPHDLNVIRVTSHMHRHGINFAATIDGAPLYQTTSWSEPPPMLFQPALAWTQGQQVTFSCTYHNDTGAPILFGTSAKTEEMCILGTLVYPVPSLAAGSFACY